MCGGLLCWFSLIFLKYPTETKLCHFHRIFINGGLGGGFKRTPWAPSGSATGVCLITQPLYELSVMSQGHSQKLYNVQSENLEIMKWNKLGQEPIMMLKPRVLGLHLAIYFVVLKPRVLDPCMPPRLYIRTWSGLSFEGLNWAFTATETIWNILCCKYSGYTI